MYYRPGGLDKLERKFGKLAIKNLMLILVGAMAIVFAMDLFVGAKTGQSLYFRLMFDRTAILNGEVWRAFTFLFLPPDSGIIFIIFSLYFYYLIGTAIENEWGAFGFTAYYFLGVIGAIASGFIAGYATNYYLNMSLFLAFAILNPNYEIYLFFFVPIKMKWLGLISGILLIMSFYYSTWGGRLSLIMALINLLVFFTPLLIKRIKQAYGKWKWKQNFKR